MRRCGGGAHPGRTAQGRAGRGRGSGLPVVASLPVELVRAQRVPAAQTVVLEHLTVRGKQPTAPRKNIKASKLFLSILHYIFLNV